MKNSKWLLIKLAAIVFMIAAVVCPFPTSVNRVGQTDVASPSTPRHLTMFDDPRPEMSIERLSDLNRPKHFDVDIVSLLKPKQEGQRGTVNENFYSYAAVASTRRVEKGERNP